MCIGISCLIGYQVFKCIKVVFIFTFHQFIHLGKHVCSICGYDCFDNKKCPSESVMESNVVYCTYKVINQYEHESDNDSNNNSEDNSENLLLSELHNEKFKKNKEPIKKIINNSNNYNNFNTTNLTNILNKDVELSEHNLVANKNLEQIV